MAVYPGATYRPVVGESKDPGIIPVGVILHVAASNADSLFGYFNGPSGGIESHFHIPLTDRAPVEQYRDTAREADANYKGNSWVAADGKRYGFLSAETAGLADGEWNQHQLDEILALIRWAHGVHHFPLRRAPGYRSPGLGYHVMFGTGEGTNSWSNARGKVCPGPRRIRQFEEVILPSLAGSAAAAPAPPQAPAQPQPSTAPRCPEAHPTLKRGAKGVPVNHLQHFLIRSGAKIAGDGDFGPATDQALRSHQAWLRAHRDPRVAVDGVCGPITWAAIHGWAGLRL